MADTPPYKTALIFGAPGVGKGTQGRILGQIPGFFHLSCGDVFRSIDIGSEEGKLVYQHTSKGQLVPDELTVRIWKNGLQGQIATSQYKPREDLLILDGIPRNVDQVEILKDYINVMVVLYLVCADEEAMIHRIRRRAIRENRADDANEDIIRHRYLVYHEESEPVLGCYDSSMIKEIDAVGSPAEVLYRVLEELIPVQNQVFKSGS